ncbi:MAG TPA: CmcJ/NvfI family oxidoreductase [Steroidobacteraceae bacterium]
MEVHAEIEFLVPGTGRPFTYAREAPPGGEPETARFASRGVGIRDVRGGEALRLDEAGATLGRWATQVRRFDDDAEVRARYYPESAEIIGAALGADRVVVFDHNVRRGGAAGLPDHGHAVGRPVRHAHTDYTPGSALQRLRQELGPHAEAGLSRFVQVNLWRPIRGPVRDAPLALCDGASVAPQALRAVELRYPQRTGEICYLVHQPGQRWYFASDMGADEAWLFKNFDSASAEHASAAPHSAFTDPRHPRVAPRESIEVRALAIFR